MSMSSIIARPHWQLPAANVLTRAVPPERTVQRFQEYEKGLREIVLYAFPHTEDGKVNKGVIQQLVVGRGAGHPPFMSAEDLCRLCWLRAERYVRSHRWDAQFRFYLFGEDDEGPFKDEGRFTIYLKQCLPDEELESDATPRPDCGENDDSSPRESDPMHNDIRDERGEREPTNDEERDRPDEIVVKPKEVVTLPQPLVERTQPQLHMNPEFIVQLERNAFNLASAAYEGSMKANRGLLHEMRAEVSEMLRDIKGIMESNNGQHLAILKEVTTFAMDHAKQSNERNKYLEDMVLKMSNQSYRSIENYQEIAKQGWMSFIDSMKMKNDIINERHDRARYLEYLAAQEKEYAAPPTPPRRSLIDELMKSAPIVLSVLGFVMRKRGDVESASHFEDLARTFASARSNSNESDSEDDDDDEDDEDYVDVEATPQPPNGRAPNGRAPNGHAHQSASTPPFVARCRRFQATLTKEQTEALRSDLPKGTWKSFERACVATSDEVAVAAVQHLAKVFSADIAVTLQIAQHLSEAQVEEILDVVKQVTIKEEPRAARPSRPGSSPNA